jgi:hypothetical protein
VATPTPTKQNNNKKGPSKNDMRMFQQFLKSYKEENNNRHQFGHDPFTTQDALDAIPGIEDIPDLDY